MAIHVHTMVHHTHNTIQYLNTSLRYDTKLLRELGGELKFDLSTVTYVYREYGRSIGVAHPHL